MELKHISAHLPYGLKVRLHNGEVVTFTVLKLSQFLSGAIGIKPILRPLSEFGDSDDLRKVHEFIGLGKWCEQYDIYFDAWFNDIANIDKLILQAPYEVIQYFFANHYDIFNLIEKGEAIDANTLQTNPYK